MQKMNNRIDVNLEHKYKYSYGQGALNLLLQSSALGSAYDYNALSLSARNDNKLERLKITTRAFCQIGTCCSSKGDTCVFMSSKKSFYKSC